MKKLLLLLLLLPTLAKAQFPTPTSVQNFVSIRAFYKIVGSDTLVYMQNSAGMWFPVGRPLHTANGVHGNGTLGASVKLGGKLTDSTSIMYTATAPFNMTDTTTNSGLFFNTSQIQIRNNNGSLNSVISSLGGSNSMLVTSGSNSTGISTNTVTGMSIIDNIFNRGPVYGADYGTNQRLQRLAIPSVGTTIALIDSVKGTISGSGTVTNIATGYGLTGGPITTTGTIVADTSSGKLATQYYARVVVGADGIVTGLVTTTSGTTATTTAGTYRLNNLLVTKGSSTNTTIDAQDATLNRYDLIVGDASGTFTKVQGTLAADAVEPDIPTNKALIASIYIPATGGTVTTGGGGSGKGTVTQVKGVNANGFSWSIANSTSIPTITLTQQNASASQSGQLTSTDWNTFNGKQASLGFTPENVANKATSFGTLNNTLYPTTQAVSTYVTGLGYITGNQTITFAPTGDVTGSTTGTTSLAPTLSIGAGKVTNTMLAGSIDLTSKVTGLLPVANGGTGTATPSLVNGTGITITGTWPNQTVTASGSGVTSVTSLGTHENPSISGSVLNIPNLWPRVWQPMGTIMTPDLVADQSTLIESSLLYEGSPQILTNTSGSVFKMWFTAGYGSPNIMYAESLDGITWIRSSTICISGHARSCVVKVSGTYYCFCSLGVAGAQIDVYSSSTGAPGSWTLLTANIITKGTGSTWNNGGVFSSSVIFDGSTWQMVLEGRKTGTVYSIGHYSASTPGGTWTADSSNPVVALNGYNWSDGDLHKIGSVYYIWVHGSGNTSSTTLPSDIYRFHSNDLTTWVIDNGGSPVYPRIQADEGVGTTVGQVADPSLIEVNGQTYMYYSADPDGNGTSGFNLKLAIANYTLANLVTTNEGNGGYINTLSNPPFYTKTVSDLNYIPNATNVGNQTVWTPGSILLDIDPATGSGIRARNKTTTTTLSVINPDNIAFNRASGVTNTIQTGTSGFNFQSWGAITFSNVSGTGTSALGNFDNTGAFTSAATITAGTGGGGFSYQVNGITSSDPLGINGFIARQGTNSTSGVPVQYSPPMAMYGNAWNTSGTPANNRVLIGWNVAPTSGATVGGALTWKSSVNFGPTTLMAALDVSGNYTVQGTISGRISGTTSKFATHGGKIKEYYTDAGNTTTTETDLYSYTTEAGMLTDNGASIKADYGGAFVSSATATRELKIYFGGTAIFDSGALTISTSGQWNIRISLIRVSSTVIRYNISMTADGVTLTSPVAVGELTGLTLSGTNILKITGQSAGTGAATNDIVGKLGEVYYWPVSQ